MIDRFLSCLMAVSLALLIWLYARSREQETLDNVPIPVDVVLASRQGDQFMLEVPGGRPQVSVSFSGPPQRLRELQMMIHRKEIRVVKTIAVADDRLEESRFSDSVVIEATDINTPQGITAHVSEGRNSIPYTMHRLVERWLPVRFDCVREGPTGPVVLEPEKVLVRGPKEILANAKEIRTQPSELPTRPLHTQANVAAIGRVTLVHEMEGRAVRVTPSTVQVRVPGQARKAYHLNDIQVHFLCPPNFHFKPQFLDERTGKLNLELLGPVQDESPRVHAYIDLSKGKFLSGVNHEPLQLQLPSGFQLVQEPPRVVAFQLLPGDFNPEGLGMPGLSSPAVPPTPE